MVDTFFSNGKNLVVCFEQPFLVSSLDSIISEDDKIKLLEIKCPYTYENSIVIDREKKVSLVPYLKFESGDLQLMESYKDYTQV